MGKKGLSWDEKRKRILDIYYEHVSTALIINLTLYNSIQQCVFNLKEIEKLGAKRGVIS